jgi:hypothetical protein
MKRSLITVMDSLDIDEEIRGLIKQLWNHSYRTLFSCKGQHSYLNVDQAYLVLFADSGDGWFEENSWRYGLKKSMNSDCCPQREGVCCAECGAGINGFVSYRGRLIADPELSGIDKEELFDFLA